MNKLKEYFSPQKLLPKNIDIISHEIVLSSLIEQIHNGDVIFENSGKNSNLSSSVHKKSIIIENILLNIPLPTLYLDITKDNKYRPVDIFGYELLKTIQSFINNEFALTNLEFLSRLNSCEYSVLPEAEKRVIFSRVISFRAFTIRMPKLDKYVVIYRILGKNILLKAHNLEPQLSTFYSNMNKLIIKDSYLFKNHIIDNDFISSFTVLLINKEELTKDINFDYFKNTTLLKINYDNYDNIELVNFIANKFEQSYYFLSVSEIIHNTLIILNRNWLLCLLVVFSEEEYIVKVQNKQGVFQQKLEEIISKKRYSNVYTVISSIKNLIDKL